MRAFINDRQIDCMLKFLETMNKSRNDIILKSTNIGKTIVEYEDEDLNEYINMLVKIGEAS